MLDRRFEGIVNLYGNDGFQCINASHILVLGIGGVGSWVCEALTRSGVGELTLVDLDDICVSNINRQVHSHQESVGQFKVDEMEKRLKLINPEVKINTLQSFFNHKSAEKILATHYDFIVDAIDNVHDKALLIEHCYQNNKKIITIGAAGGKKDPGSIKINDLNRTIQDKLLFQVKKRLRKDYQHFRRLKDKRFKIPAVFSEEKAVSLQEIDSCTSKKNCSSGFFGSSVAITGTMGFLAASYVLNELASE